MSDLKICNSCGKATMQYLDNEKNNYAFLICPKCFNIDDSELYVTVSERIQQGYSRYERANEKRALYEHEHFIVNNEDEKD